MDETLLSRVEDAGLNASAPPQQRWVDGWLLRFSPGSARRARCINAVADGRLPLAERLRVCEAVYRDAGLPMLLRVTRFSQPAGIDDALARLGFDLIDDTLVMVRPTLPTMSQGPGQPWPCGLACEPLNGADYAAAIGALRASSPAQVAAHTQRLALSPVPYAGFALRRSAELLACGQVAIEGEFAGLYDVATHPDHQRQGFAQLLCERLLIWAASRGARVGYLQVGGDNLAAQRVYQRLGFAEAYRYHYRQRLGS